MRIVTTDVVTHKIHVLSSQNKPLVYTTCEDMTLKLLLKKESKFEKGLLNI